MPDSGAERPCFSASRTEAESPVPGSSDWMVSLIEPMVSRRPQKAEKHQQAHEVARGVAGFVEAGGDRIQHGAHGTGGDGDRRRAAKHRLHRRQQDGGGGFHAGAEGVHPPNLAKQAADLREGEQNADDEHAEDQAVQAGIGGKGRVDLAGQNDGDEADQPQKDDHGEQEHLRTGKLVGIIAQHIRAAAYAERSEQGHPSSILFLRAGGNSNRICGEIGSRTVEMRGLCGRATLSPISKLC
jgi:hypothetical protein